MELEKLNKQYETERAKYETLNAEKAKMELLRLALWDAKVASRNLKEDNERAKISGENPPHDKTELAAAEKKIEEATRNLEEFRKQVKEALDKVNSRYAELEQDSEMKAHLNNILAKRMERSIKKEEAKRDAYKEIKEIFEAHPNAKNLIKGIANKNKEISILEDKIQKLEEKATRTPDEDTELRNHKLHLIVAKKDVEDRKIKVEKEFLQKNYPNLSAETKAVLFGLNTVDMDKAIKGTERNIQNRKNVYREVTGRDLGTEERTQEAEQQSQTKNGSRAQLPAEVKLPFYKRLWHWIKTGDWIKKGETITRSEPQTQEPSREQGETSPQEQNQSKFRNAYKYEIVQDYVEQKEAQLLKQHNERKKQQQQRQDEER